MQFNIFRLDPIRRFALFLIIFSGLALGYNFSNDVLLHLASTLGFGLILFWLFSRISTKQKNVWDTVITTLIIFLLLHYGANPFYPLIATFFALTLKFFIEWRGSPVVNPAAAALLLTAGVLALIPGLDQPFISWWGASFWQLPFGLSVSFILLAIWILGGFYVWRKWAIFFGFLLTYFLLVLIFYSISDNPGIGVLQFAFTDSTVFFLASIMLSEPKTSPVLPWKQGAYGFLAALAYHVLAITGVSNAALFAVVAANLFNASFRLRKNKNPAQ